MPPINWAAQVKFYGNAEEWRHLWEIMHMHRIVARIPEWEEIHRRKHLAGCNPFPIDALIGPDFLKQVLVDKPILNLSFVQDINGGIRTPHLHLEDKVALLDRESFKAVVGRIASVLAEKRVEEFGDYIDVMAPVGDLANPARA